MDDLKAGTTDKSPIKRRVTLIPAKQKGILPRTRTKQHEQLNSQGKKDLENLSDRDSSHRKDITSQADGEKGDTNNADGVGEGNVHKKKIKKNVDSRDACT